LSRCSVTATALLVASVIGCSSGPVASPDASSPVGSVAAPECLRTTPDFDRDGLADGCEMTLVTSFAPLLVVAPDQCSASKGLPPGGYLYGAQPEGDGVRLVYLPAYLQDCGWGGAKCHLPRVSCAPHIGDSEFIAMDVAGGPDGLWSVRSVFLSAHCFAGSGADCRWYGAGELDAFAWSGPQHGSAPVIWVAEGRNANYPSRRSCDRGHFYLDTCDRNTVRERFPIVPGLNLGSRNAPIRDGDTSPGCVRGSTLREPRADPEAVECFWSDAPFRGWRGEGPGATAYGDYLEQIARF
jgi:hypothetical protein